MPRIKRKHILFCEDGTFGKLHMNESGTFRSHRIENDFWRHKCFMGKLIEIYHQMEAIGMRILIYFSLPFERVSLRMSSIGIVLHVRHATLIRWDHRYHSAQWKEVALGETTSNGIWSEFLARISIVFRLKQRSSNSSEYSENIRTVRGLALHSVQHKNAKQSRYGLHRTTAYQSRVCSRWTE